MKIIQLALALLLLAGTAHAADNKASVAPATPQAVNASALIGSWNRETNVPKTGLVDAEITFAKDGTFHGQVQVEARRIWKFAGKWQVQDGNILYDYTESDREDIPAGTKDKDRIIKITPTKLVIESEMGEETYLRKNRKKEHDLYIGPR